MPATTTGPQTFVTNTVADITGIATVGAVNVPHNHGAGVGAGGGHTHGVNAANAAHGHNVNGNTTSTGGGTAHQNMPPFIAIGQIIRVTPAVARRRRRP